MSDNVEPVTEHDGSISSAANALAGMVNDDLTIDDGDTSEARERDDAGRFKAKPDGAADGDKDADDVPEDGGEPDKGGEPQDDDDDWVEIASEIEGEEPERIKLSDLYDGYRQSNDLSEQLENVKATQPPPPEYEKALQETLGLQTQYMGVLEQYKAYNPIQEPSLDLLNQDSPNYNPDLYAQQRQAMEQTKAAHARIDAELNELKNRQAREAQVLHEATRTRELAKLHEFWPEMKTSEAQRQFVDDIQRHYGVDKGLLDTIVDARFFKVAKDALAYQRQQAATEKAVKKVRAKPKLIPAKARSTTNSKHQKVQSSMNRLQKSGSLDDAASAISGLLD